jgi:hypothetical protein
VIASQTIFLVNDDGQVPNELGMEQTEVRYDLRAEWVLKYTVKDKWNNEAAPVTFSMILDDTQPPVITTSYTKAETQSCDKDSAEQVSTARTHLFAVSPSAQSSVLAHSTQHAQHTTAHRAEMRLPCLSTPPAVHPTPRTQDPLDRKVFNLPLSGLLADDNYDGILTPDINITITSPSGAVHTVTKGSTLATPMDSSRVGRWTIEYSCADRAGMFGRYAQNNVGVFTSYLDVVDSVPPSLYCRSSRYALEPRQTSDGTVLRTIPAGLREAGRSCGEECDRFSAGRVVGSLGPSGLSASSLEPSSAAGGGGEGGGLFTAAACTHFEETTGGICTLKHAAGAAAPALTNDPTLTSHTGERCGGDS